MSSNEPQQQLLRLLPFVIPAAAVLFLLGREEQHNPGNPNPLTKDSGKEPQFLRYNKDEIFKGILSTEGHLRNVESKEKGGDGFLNCAVKHLADVEGHEDEAISHSLIAENEHTSEGYRQLRDETRNLRHNLQDGNVSPAQAIIRVRQIRHKFEQMNPEYDVSKCKACEIT